MSEYLLPVGFTRGAERRFHQFEVFGILIRDDKEIIPQVINLILVTVSLLFIADYVIIFDNAVDQEVLEIIRALFRTAALSFLAYGGAKIADS